MGYKQLSLWERYTIRSLMKLGFSNKLIATKLRRHPSTIGREIKRNLGKSHYAPKQAHRFAEERRFIPRKPEKINGTTELFIVEKLKEKWSPEQIAGKIKLDQPDGVNSVSHECIYQYLRKNRKNGGDLYKNLRRSGRKYRKKRFGSSRIPNRVSIDERPEYIDKKERIGDWEGDLIVGKGHMSAMLTLVERKTKYTVIVKLPKNKEAKSLSRAMIQKMAKFKDIFHSLTLDNGLEFADHDRIRKALGVQIYFCHPFSSWERGLNENTNGLIRQFFKKGSDLSKISVEEVLRTQNLLNGNLTQVTSFFEKLSDKTVCILIQTSFPRTERVTKIDLNSECFTNPVMIGKFKTIIQCQRMKYIFELCHLLDHSST